MKAYQSSVQSQVYEQPFSWNTASIAKYTNTENFKKLQYVPGRSQSPGRYQSPGRLSRASNVQNGFDNLRLSTVGSDVSSASYVKQPKLSVQQELDRNDRISDKYNRVFDQKMKKAKAEYDNQIQQQLQMIGPSEGKIDESEYRYQLEIIRQRVKFDVAWQIFDEINYYNDTLQFIELTCLDHTDAIAITKQKIFELARQASEKSNQNRHL